MHVQAKVPGRCNMTPRLSSPSSPFSPFSPFSRLIAATLLLLAALLPIQAGAQGAATVNNERVNIRQGPGEQYGRSGLLDKDSKVTEISRQNGWSQVRTSDGKT